MLKVTNRQIQDFIREPYLQRGQAIFENGDVVFNKFSDRSVTAFCCGTRVYSVQISIEETRLKGYCSCPAFVDFGLCKHLAATALAAMANNNGQYVPNQLAIDRVDANMELKNQIASLEKFEIVELLFQCSDEETIEMMLDGFG